MKDINEMKHCEYSENLVKVLMDRTQNDSPLFFRVLVAYYFAQVASMMRTNIVTHDRGKIPVSMYALNLSPSGTGKGFSTNLIEEQVIHKFKKNFLDITFPTLAEKNLAKLAVYRAAKYQEDPDDMLEKVRKEFERAGQFAFSFDSGTSAAIKQMRHKLLMADAGSLNLQIDEIGSNLLSNIEVLTTYLELFDVGKIKQKLTKNTNENIRGEEIDGKTPTNMLLFGTPAKLLNGSKIEEEFYSMLETGYARRCIFGYNKTSSKRTNLTASEVYDLMTSKVADTFLETLSERLGRLADIVNFDTAIQISKEVTLTLLEYKLDCERKAEEFQDHEEILKAELSHRYYKALKLAGAYAFIEGNYTITEDNLYAAIKLVEESGEAFRSILTRERNYVKLARYIASIGHEVTQVDLVEDLPFYKGSEATKKDMMALAIAWGHKNNIIIKRSYSDNIEFLKGESMIETDLNKMSISYSTHITENFRGDYAPFDGLHKLTTLSGYHYTAHHFKGGYRSSVNLIEGFNLVILDVDGGISLSTAQMLLSGYKALFCTTKSHTEQKNRFRILLPLSHTVKLNSENYKQFMQNVFDWLPFDVDTAACDSARKWETFAGQHSYQEGSLLDAMLFIPKTAKAEEQAKKILDHQSLSNLERWFALGISVGNRSKQIIKYALLLVDNGYSFDQVKNSIFSFNDKLKDGLTEEEINSTIMVTVMKRIAQRETA